MKPLFQLLVLSVTFLGHAATEQSTENETKKEIKDEVVKTTHTMTLDQNPLSYKSTVGTMVLKDNEAKPKASVFYVAYIKEGTKDAEERPLTFCFNGGPGSSSIWLHLGILGPKRVEITEDGYVRYPIKIVDNPHTLLEVTDLVFIDPVSTGYSRSAPGEDPKQFHGVEEDIQWVAEFIRLYTTRNKRWSSPKFLAGESYGTTRAAGLAGYLHDQHLMDLDGIVLLSSVLNFQTLRDTNRGNDLPYMLYLPSFTAAAWYHKKLPDELLKRPLLSVLEEVETFVLNDYSQALMRGCRIDEAKKQEVMDHLSYYTGLSKDYIAKAHLRVDPLRFCSELMRDEESTIGRFDSRYKGVERDCLKEIMTHDPSFDAIAHGFAAAFNQYVSRDLEWEKDEPYNVLNYEVHPWNFGSNKNEYLNVGETLRDVMTRNPRLQVFVASGFYDLATPYFATEYTKDHLGLKSAVADHIKVHYYDAGHMMYTHYPSLVKLANDLKEFYRN